MFPNRVLQVVAPAIGERNEYLSPVVQVNVLRDGLPDSALVGGQVSLSLISPDPVLYPGTLVGTKVGQAIGGSVLFNPLSVDVPGPYTLRAMAENTDFTYLNDSSDFWRMTLPPTSTLADPMYIGRWINITGAGVPFGIWAKIVSVFSGAQSYWILEQPRIGPTSLSALATLSGNFSVRYNSQAPNTPPAVWTGIGTDVWFLWDPLGGEFIQTIELTPVVETLVTDVALEILRNVSIQITSYSSQVQVGETRPMLAVIKNQNGTVATDLNGEFVEVQVRSGVTPVHTVQVPVVNGNVFTNLVMPSTEGEYSIWVSYQGTWYQAAQVTDEKAILVTDIEDPPEEPPQEPPTKKAPPKEYTLESGGCPLIFAVSCGLELAAPDPHLEVLVK